MSKTLSLCIVSLTVGCASFTTDGFDAARAPSTAPLTAGSWPDFPAERDLALLFPLEEDPLVPASTRLLGGSAALPSSWVDRVGEAFWPTIVEDGFSEESWYEDWRLVSVRVSPCAPVARSPALAPASVCWPVVRLVWQPVVGTMDRGGVQIDAWADDRAIHAIYPVVARDPSGRRMDQSARERVTDRLEAGGRLSDLSAAELAAFEDSRDRTTAWLLDEVAGLRDRRLPLGSWDGLDDRPELAQDSATAQAFRTRLVAFLSETAAPADLRELTAFSLPAGRQPSLDDAWVFVQFGSDGRSLLRRSLEVYSRTDGGLLLDYGLDQDAGQTHESPAVEEALDADPTGELHDTVVSSSEDVDEILDLIVDPEEVFVPNTTCATCHRLNGLRFDFHSLSHFEDNAHTISPRVVADVARDRAWSEDWLAGEGWETPSTTGDSGAAPSAPAEPNETPATASQIPIPYAGDFEIEDGDIDHFAVRLEVPTTVTVQVELEPGSGDLDLAVLDDAGNGLAFSESTSPLESVTVTLPAGRSVIRVYGYGGATGGYRLRIN